MTIEVAFVLVDLAVQIGIATKYFGAAWMIGLKLGVTRAGVIVSHLALQAVFFPVELSLLLPGYVPAIFAGVVLLLSSYGIVFTF